MPSNGTAARACASVGLLLLLLPAAADEFTNVVAAADRAERNGDLVTALATYDRAKALAAGSAADWCTLSRRYSDLMPFTNAPAAPTALLDRATDCAQEAVQLAPNSAAAHAALAVCYGKHCTLADVKGQVKYSRLLKQEADTAIALDPRQDIAYYLLGRWNEGVAHIGFWSRAFVKVVYGGLPKASDEAAIENFKKAIALVPQRILYHAGLASAYAAAGNRDQETAELKKCQALAPMDMEDQNARLAAADQLKALAQ